MTKGIRIPDFIESGNDLALILAINNLFPEGDIINIYDDHIELYALTSEEELPYFDENFIKIYVPNNGILIIDLVDYGEEIDVLERQAVKQLLSERIGNMIDVDEIILRY